MKRLNSVIRDDGTSYNFTESMFDSWDSGIRNTGKNLGVLTSPLNYYIIANDAVLEGL